MNIDSAYNLMLKEYADLLTVQDVQKILGVSRHTVYHMVDYGELYAVKVGKAYKVSKLRLIEYIVGTDGRTQTSNVLKS